jgi:predicted anti-sigma-YlaC factor YlaD
MGVGCQSCRWVRDRLPLLAGGELTGTDRRSVERHLITCAACRDERRSLSGALDVLRLAATLGAGSSDSPSLWPALERQIRESRRAPRPSPWAEWRDVLVLAVASPRWRSAATLAAVLVGTGLMAGGVEIWTRHQLAASRAALAAAARPRSIDHATAAPTIVLPPPVDAVAAVSIPRSEAPSRPAPRVDYDLDRGTPMGDGGDVKASY